MTERRTDEDVLEELENYMRESDDHATCRACARPMVDHDDLCPFGIVAQRLRDMPEGERIEGWARMLDPNCSCAEARQWGVDKDCGHYHDLPSYQRCTLILDTRKEGESDE